MAVDASQTMSADDRAQERAKLLTGALVVAAACLFGLTVCITPIGGSGLIEATSAFFLWLSIGAFLICRSAGDQAERNKLLIVFFIAYTIRFLAAMILFPVFSNNYIYPDHWTYLNKGAIVADRWADNPFEVLRSLGIYGHGGIYLYVGGLLKISGQPLVIAATHTFFSAYCVILLYRLGARLIDEKINNNILFIGALTYALFPLSIYWSTPLLKEPLVSFFCLLFIEKLYCYLKGKLFVSVLYMVVCITMILMFRFYMAAVIVITALLSMLMYTRIVRYVRISTFIIAALCVCAIVVYRPILDRSNVFAAVSQSSDKVIASGFFSVISETRNAYAGMGKTDVSQMQFSSVSDIPKLLPIAVFRIFTTPVRWFGEKYHPTRSIEIFCTAVWYIILPFSIAGFFMWLAQGGYRETPVLLFLMLSLLVNSFLFLGGSPRHNNILFPFFCLFAAFGLFRWKDNLYFALMVYLLLGAVLAAVEFSLMPAAILIAPAALTVVAGMIYALWVVGRNKKTVHSVQGPQERR